MSKNLKFSKFVHFFERNSVTAIFHALSREIVFMDQASLIDLQANFTGAAFTNIQNDTIDTLKENGFVILANVDESDSIKPFQNAILQRPCIDTMYLLLIDQCNFACSYCFFEGSYKDLKKKTEHMTKEMAIVSIRQFAKYLKKAYSYTDFIPYEPSIVFYGGEPLINAGIFRDAVEEVASLKKSGDFPQSLQMNINTNGSLVTDELASFCTKHNIEVDVSLDGYESIHDACRVWTSSNKGTFADVMRGIDILKKHGAKACISCTVSESNVKELPEIFKWFLDVMGISNIGFNPLLNSHQYKIDDPDYSLKITNAMIECFKIARERGANEARIMRKVNAFVDGTVYDRDCCGCGKQVVVLPSGKIGVCHAYSGTAEYFVNQEQGFDPFEHPLWNEWSKRSPINMPQCYDCEALTICGGGCPHNAEINKGSIWELDDSFCVHAKETLLWLIWDLYDQSN